MVLRVLDPYSPPITEINPKRIRDLTARAQSVTLLESHRVVHFCDFILGRILSYDTETVNNKRTNRYTTASSKFKTFVVPRTP